MVFGRDETMYGHAVECREHNARYPECKGRDDSKLDVCLHLERHHKCHRESDVGEFKESVGADHDDPASRLFSSQCMFFEQITWLLAHHSRACLWLVQRILRAATNADQQRGCDCPGNRETQDDVCCPPGFPELLGQQPFDEEDHA